MPTANTLTDNLCKKAAPGKAFDGHGLYLDVAPTGRKVWRMAYRIAGKPQTATFGPYPLITLAQAREKRDELRRKLLDGADPRPQREKRTAGLLEAAQTYWNDHRQDISPSYRANVLRGIEMHLAGIREVPIGQVTTERLLAELNKMNAAGLFVYVRKVRVWIGQVFDWAVAQNMRKDNPAKAIDPEKAFGRAEVQSHAALELTDLPEFFRRLKLEDQILSVLGCKMLALTWVRTTELRLMEWSEIEGDLWRIPAGKMKRKKDHIVPLSKQALAILEQLRARARGRFVFPNDRRPEDRPMSENSILYLLGRIGYGGRMTGHGFRSVGSTWANERNYNPDAIERQLAHVPRDKTRAVYNRAAYLDVRRSMLQAWADWIDDAYAGRV